MTAGLFDATEYATKLSQVDAFVAPPTSVLDAQQGYWQDRRTAWENELPALARSAALGRDDLGGAGFGHLAGSDDEVSRKIGAVGDTATVFDPVLAEVAYRWWTTAGDAVFDPFAGGPVRGLVAATLGRDYVGVDVRQEQVDLNEDAGMPGARWVVGNASTCRPAPCDFVFSCPPYGTLERYSDNPADLSTMTWSAFRAAYRQAIDRAVGALRVDRFAVFVVGNYKERGELRDLVGLTVDAFGSAGADLYADLVFIPPAGSAALRAASSFPVNRRPMPRHQAVLCFVKGDARKAAERVT